MRPNLYILGETHTGKTPLAEYLATQLNLRLVSGSEWVKARYHPPPEARGDRARYVREITELSCLELARDPDACVRYIRTHHRPDTGGCVIEGLRNPRDFALLFRPERDLVLSLRYPQNSVPPTEFEGVGLGSIRNLMTWMREVGMVEGARHCRIALESLRDSPSLLPSLSRDPNLEAWLPNLQSAMEFALRWALPHMAEDPARGEIVRVHCPLDRIPSVGKVWVSDRVLYDEDPTLTGWSPGRLLSLSSYSGDAPTFQVLLDNGSVFSYVPPHRLLFRDPAECSERLELEDLVYFNCPDEQLTVEHYAALAGPCQVWLVRRREWRGARYLFTADWPQSNRLAHALVLDSGQVALQPSHKVRFGPVSLDSLPPYRKLRATWRVPNPEDDS